MARPREFDEETVLDAAIHCFWTQGYEAASVRVLAERTGLTTASLYNAFGDKRALYLRALDHYVENGVTARIRRCRALPPRQAVEAFFTEVVERSLADPERKGCLLVNTAIDVAPRDPGLQAAVAEVLGRVEGFFRDSVAAGQADGSIGRAIPADDLARHLLAVFMGIRVLSRVRPEPGLIRGALAPALALLDQ